MLTLRQMTYFVALADTRSFSAAAERAHVTQPALSQQIKEMELSLGAQLVERLPRDIRLTRAGQVVLERAQQVLAMIRDLEAEIRQSKGLTGRLSLGVIPTIAPYLLPRALTRIKAAALDLDLRVREAQTADLLTAVINGQLDAAVIALPYDVAGLMAEPLFTDNFLLAGSKSRIEALSAAIAPPRPTDLPPDALLLLDEGHCLADQALDVCGLTRARQTVDLGASSLSTLCGLVAQGFGLTFVPEIALCSEQAASPDMTVLRFPEPQPQRTIALVRRHSTEATTWFTDLAALLSEAGSEMMQQARRRG
ncbi:LysR family transcriptional regulator, hydrogen peroxide-inducible genes activator [Celeribacter baekdonensis]|jgi:LysR family hydrogen peroxide-inducible transcriptional activator|uniref:LysR family transcriptional regulator, hydrogen peroxide-inducible genes activator n=1 Tax=Celeribacter baekdonensis TaxID=875171 RepID=A0A1G7FW20_9RHOB|nr:hydrogen peroxide-inducible genes activator [Celeribacter baekdonensis]SDE79982.1 LysR family transcriptional regulator, hydrogen peroxide-inducible genes activator [Celeribacter baekdonensis]